MALAVELFKAQRFVVAGLVADGQAAEAGELGKILEAGRIETKATKRCAPTTPTPGWCSELANFRKGPAGLEHQPPGLRL